MVHDEGRVMEGGDLLVLVHVELCNVKGLCLHGYMKAYVCVAAVILLSGMIQPDRFSGMDDDEEETKIPQIFSLCGK